MFKGSFPPIPASAKLEPWTDVIVFIPSLYYSHWVQCGVCHIQEPEISRLVARLHNAYSWFTLFS